jgi:hypothetical protein
VSVVALIKISLNFGVVPTRFLPIQKVEISGALNDKIFKDGSGMSKMNQTIKASISTCILTSNHIPTTMEHRSGNRSMKKIASGKITNSFVRKKEYCIILLVDCIRVFRHIYRDFTKIVHNIVYGQIYESITINSILITPNIKEGYWIIQTE